MLSLSVPVPCIRGQFGDDLLAFQTFVKPSEVINLLGHDPRSQNWRKLPDDLRDMYEYLQRKTVKGRREGTARYIEERIGPEKLTVGAFPAIAIGMVTAPNFESYNKHQSTIDEPVGVLKLDLSASNKRVLLDGLARVTGALNLIESGQEELANSFTFPVTIYAPTERHGKLELWELGQLFHDFNFLQAPVTANQAIALDRSNIYILLTNELGKSQILRELGGMEARAASLGSKSSAIVVQRVLLRFVRGACEGRYFQESNRDTVQNPNLTKKTFNELKADLEGFIDGVAREMGHDRFRDRDSIHLTAPGWQAFGLIFHDMHVLLKEQLNPATGQQIYKRIASIDWTRSNRDWFSRIGEAEIDKTTGEVLVDEHGQQRVALGRGGRQTVWAIAQYIREKTGLDLMLKTQGIDPDEERLQSDAA